MTLTYLHQTGTIVVDSNGNGSVTLRPDVGQYWMPKFVRVSIVPSSAFILTPYCAVYHGLTVGTISPTTFIDDTLKGDGDSSGVINGTVISFGDGITAKWTGCHINDTCVLDVYGETSSVPPPFNGTGPGDMGPHFYGKPPVSSLSSIALDFTNPGPSNSVRIIPVGGKTRLLLSDMHWHWTTTDATLVGDFLYDDTLILMTDIPADLTSRYMSFSDLPSQTINDSLNFHQRSGAAVAGTLRCVGCVTFNKVPVIGT